MVLALEGIKVIDVSQVTAVPMAARHLADFGADVIHVENPTTGDSWRVFQAGVSGTGTGSGAPSEINYTWEMRKWHWVAGRLPNPGTLTF